MMKRAGGHLESAAQSDVTATIDQIDPFTSKSLSAIATPSVRSASGYMSGGISATGLSSSQQATRLQYRS